MKLPYQIIKYGDESDDEFADKRGTGNTVRKPWYFMTLQSKRPCDICGKIGSYRMDTDTPSYDVTFCLNEFDRYRVSKKNKKCTCKYCGHGNKCYFKKFKNYREPTNREQECFKKYYESQVGWWDKEEESK